MIHSQYFVYITTNPGKTTLYTGVTNDLDARLQQHYNNRGNPETFAGKYHCHKLLYFEKFDKIEDAIETEKEIKNLTREKKKLLIAEENPYWHFLKL